MITYGFIIPPNATEIDLLNQKTKKPIIHHAKYAEQYIDDNMLNQDFKKYEIDWINMHSSYCSKLDYAIRILNWIKVGTQSPMHKTLTLSYTTDSWKLNTVSYYKSLGYFIDYI